MRKRRPAPILIKRYGGSRLYDPVGRRYVAVPQLRAWAANGVAFIVEDAETGADVTVAVLA